LREKVKFVYDIKYVKIRVVSPKRTITVDVAVTVSWIRPVRACLWRFVVAGLHSLLARVTDNNER